MPPAFHPKGQSWLKGQRMTLRIQLSYELDPHYGSDAAEEILIALGDALPRIEAQALAVICRTHHAGRPAH